MDEDFLDVTKNNNKVIFAVLLIIIIALLSLGYIFVYRPHHFGLKTLTLEVGDSLPTDINDYLKESVVDTSLYKLDLSRVKTDEVGTYDYYIMINKNKQSGKIRVVDTKAPEFTLKENFKIEENDEDFFIGDVIESCSDLSLPCLVNFKNEKDANAIKNVGTYNIAIVVSDIYKNKSEALVKIEVLKKGSIVREEELDLVFATSSSELPEFKGEYYIKLDKAIKAESDEVRDAASEISAEAIEEYVKTNYPNNTIKNSEIVSMYNKSGYVIGFVIKVSLNNDRIIYIPSNKTGV